MKFVYVIVLAMGLSACSYNVDKTGGAGDPMAQGPVSGAPAGSATGPGSAPGAGAGPDALDTRLSFSNVFAKAIQTSCFPCHAAPRNAGGVNLQSYASVFGHKDEVEQAVDSRFMPDSQGRTMTDENRALLLEWIRAGAPEKGVPRGAAAAETAPTENEETL